MVCAENPRQSLPSAESISSTMLSLFKLLKETGSVAPSGVSTSSGIFRKTPADEWGLCSSSCPLLWLLLSVSREEIICRVRVLLYVWSGSHFIRGKGEAEVEDEADKDLRSSSEENMFSWVSSCCCCCCEYKIKSKGCHYLKSLCNCILQPVLPKTMKIYTL